MGKHTISMAMFNGKLLVITQGRFKRGKLGNLSKNGASNGKLIIYKGWIFQQFNEVPGPPGISLLVSYYATISDGKFPCLTH